MRARSLGRPIRAAHYRFVPVGPSNGQPWAHLLARPLRLTKQPAESSADLDWKTKPALLKPCSLCDLLLELPVVVCARIDNLIFGASRLAASGGRQAAQVVCGRPERLLVVSWRRPAYT